MIPYTNTPHLDHPDPITGRKLSAACWNGHHTDSEGVVSADCTNGRCHCMCHDTHLIEDDAE